MDDLRSLNAQLKTALNERIPSVEALCDLLLAPLQFLQLAEGTSQKNAWTELPIELRLVFIERYLPNIQIILIQKIYLDWHEQLRDEGRFDKVFEQWFYPSGNCQAPPEHQALIALSAYKSILSILSSTANPLESKTVDLHPSTFSSSCQLLSSLSTDYSIDTLYFNLLNASKDGSKKRSTWTDIIQSLFAVPAKIANAHSRVKQCQIPDRLQWSTYMSALALSFETLLSTPSISMIPAQSAEVLSKFARVGFLKTYHLSGSSLTSFWHVVLPHLWPRIQQDTTAVVRWRQAMSELSQSDLISFASSLCSYVSSDDCVLHFDIDPFSLDKESSQRVKTVANLLRSLFGPVKKGSDGDMARAIIRGCFLQKEGWQIGWSRVLVCWCAWSEPDVAGTEGLEWLLEETVSNWVNANVIEHSSVQYHTYLTSTFLLCVSSLPRAHPAIVDISTRSAFLNSIQAHLSCLRIPVRLMGMLAAEIVSARSLAPDSTVAPLDFGNDIWEGDGQAKSDCAALRKLLVERGDGEAKEIEISAQAQPRKSASNGVRASSPKASLLRPSEEVQPKVQKKKESKAKAAQSNSKIQIIDSSTPASDSEDDLVPYNMPATAEESDSDLDDPSAYTSNKKKAPPPVYIADLTAYLRATDDAEKLGMGLQEAAGLIRKKTGWGLELEEHAVDLAFALLGLQDNYDLDQFDQRKQDALVALLVGCPDKAAPALIEQFFLHQYSVAQRMAVLAALALSSRELAGLPSPSPSNYIQTNKFPSKTLPDKLHKQLMQGQEAASDRVIGSLAVSSIDAINASLAQTSISDTRSATTDRLPAASREKLLSVGKITRENTQRTPATTSTPRFAAVASECYLMPLINRMWLYLRDVSHQSFTAGSDGIILSSVTLSRFYSCLTVMLDASRHSSHFLAVLVPECLELCLGMRGVSSEEQVLAGQLQTMLTALNASVALDAGRTLRVSFRELVWKIKDFAETIWEGPQAQQEASSTRFAAGVLLRADEVLGL